MNITEKILTSHLIGGRLVPGEEIEIKIDQVLTQDATGTLVFQEFETFALDRIKNELAVSYVDHNTIQTGFENADDHRYLQSAAAKFGAIFSKPGNGICHQLHLERFAAPGKTLLGSDSHTPTAGALGMIAIGAGGVDVAAAMAVGSFHINSPKIIRIDLEGHLKSWISAKDIALKILEIFGTSGNTNSVFEYGGAGTSTLSVPERATIANMGAECGIITSIFPADKQTRLFLKVQDRSQLWKEIIADDDAEYGDKVTINLSELEPLVAAPDSPGNIVSAASLQGMPVDQVLIGSCTNSSYRDLKIVASILRGRKVHPSVSLGVAIGSRQVLMKLAAEGTLSHLLKAGARLLEPACGFCIGNSMAPGTNAVSLRTSNRNFKGRSGTQSAKVYLVSPELAAVSAVSGCITDPRSSCIDYPHVSQPTKFDIDDSLFLKPADNPADIEIRRGPNIKNVPKNEIMPDTIKGSIAIKLSDEISTDHIIPAGERMKYRANIPFYAKFMFENLDPEFYERAKRNKEHKIHNIIVAGFSYGQGSSREHAALCPMFLGVKAVIAKSIERIHQNNLINFGIIPFVFASPEDYGRIKQGDNVFIPTLHNAIEYGQRIILHDETANLKIPLKLSLSERKRRILLSGGLLNYISANLHGM